VTAKAIQRLDDVAMDEVRLPTPVSDTDIARLKLGDVVYLDGFVYTARESVYRMVVERGRDLPDSVQRLTNVNFHCSPAATVRPDGTYAVEAVTATASFRFGRSMARWFERTGARVIVGKAGLTELAYREWFVPHGAVYLTTVGYGMGAAYGRGITRVREVHWLRELGIDLPPPAAPVASYVPVSVAGGLAFVAGQVPLEDGAAMVTGRLGAELATEEGATWARRCALQALAALRDGEVVGVFPEATISRSFTIKDLKNGAVRLAAAAGVPLIPMALWGSQRMWTKGHPRTLTRRHVPIIIAIGEPLSPQRRDDSEAVTAELRQRLSALLDRIQRGYPDAPAGPDDRWWQPAHLGGSAPTPEEAEALDSRTSA